MGIQINIGDHKSPFDVLQPISSRHLHATRWARRRAKEIAATVKSADKYFKSLPRRRSLTDLLADGRIWINYAPNVYIRGIKLEGSNEIGIGELAYVGEQRMVLSGVLTTRNDLTHADATPAGRNEPKPELELERVVEPALARALVLAAEAGRWAIVEQIARELKERRKTLASTPSPLLRLHRGTT